MLCVNIKIITWGGQKKQTDELTKGGIAIKKRERSGRLELRIIYLPSKVLYITCERKDVNRNFVKYYSPQASQSDERKGVLSYHRYANCFLTRSLCGRLCRNYLL